MEFPGKLNAVEIKEATRFVRPKGYNARMAFSYVRMIVYAAIVVFVLFESFYRHAHIPRSVIVTRIVILLIIIGVFYYRYRRGTRQAVANLDATLPDTLSLSTEGVRLNGPNGAQGFQPWASYTGFREGQHVVLLDRKEKGLYNVIAISALDPGQRQQLVGLLQSHLPNDALRR